MDTIGGIMDELLIRIAENSIVLSIMIVAWRLAENRAKFERERVHDITMSYIEYMKENSRK